VNYEISSQGQPARVGLRDRVLALRAQPMFDGLDDDGLLLLAEHGGSASYADGEVIAVEGAVARAVFLVLEGSVVVSHQGRQVTTRLAGDAFGALPLLAREPSMLALAGGETRLLEIPAAAFEVALIENYSLLRNTLRMLGGSVLRMRGNLPLNPDVPRAVDEGHYYAEPRSLVELLIQLRRSPFGQMNLDALVDVARNMVEVRFAAGELLWPVGGSSSHALHIDAGRVRCTSADGKHVAVGRGFTIGVLDAWTRTRVYEARTETPVIAFSISFEGFLALLEAHPEVGLELLRGFARDLTGGLHAGASMPAGATSE
jgi:CRP-like cAMP-binding protein